MKRSFLSFVFGCRVNEAERAQIDRQLVEVGFTLDFVLPTFLIINTCAITGKAEREARQLVNQLRKKYPSAQIVLTGCSATLWDKYNTKDTAIADILVPNDKKPSLVSILLAKCATYEVAKGHSRLVGDKFRLSNRLLVKIQDGCHLFCSYCIVPYLRGKPISTPTQQIEKLFNNIYLACQDCEKL